jgi:hypothetical protein
VSLNANSGQSSGAINFWSEARIANAGGEHLQHIHCSSFRN